MGKGPAIAGKHIDAVYRAEPDIALVVFRD